MIGDVNILIRLKRVITDLTIELSTTTWEHPRIHDDERYLDMIYHGVILDLVKGGMDLDVIIFPVWCS